MKKLSNHKWAFLVGLIILSVAFVRPPTHSPREMLAFAFRCGAILLFAAWIFESVNIYVGLFLALAVFSHSAPTLAVSGFKQIQTDHSFIALSMVTFGCIYYSVIVSKCREFEWVFNALCALTLVHVYFLYVYRVHGIGITFNPNESSALLALCAPAFFRRRWVFLIPVVVAGLIFSRSTGGALAFMAAVLVFFGMKDLKRFLVVSAAMLFGLTAFLLFVDVPGFEWRWIIQKDAFRLALANRPLIGFGLGNWSAIYPGMARSGAFHQGCIRLHNEFLQVLVEMGAIAAIPIIGYFADILFRIRRSVDHFVVAAIAAIIVCSLANSMFRMNALNAMVAITWLAILEVKLKTADVRRQHSRRPVGGCPPPGRPQPNIGDVWI